MIERMSSLGRFCNVRKLSHLVVILACLVATASWADQVKVLTRGSGSGSTGNATHQVRLTVGQGVIGKAGGGSGQSGARLGFWELLKQTYVVSPVGEGAPVARNQLFGNYPNPFNPSTRIDFSLVKQTEVRLDVYDLKGRRVETLLRAVKPAGNHSVIYQPRNLASGVYLVLMRADDYRATQRIMLVK